jgi:hypothetical protein
MAKKTAKNPAAVALGKMGAAVTNSKLTAAERRANAIAGAKARWSASKRKQAAA